MIYDQLRFSVQAGDVLHIEVGDEISLECSSVVHGIFAALTKTEGVSEVTLAYASLAARVDFRSARLASIEKAAEKARSRPVSERMEGRRVNVPVCYEGQFAPDLDWVAEKTALKKEEVVKLHAAKEYTCMMLGFAPGFVYLDEVDQRIRADRLETPRTKVAAGSVGIAGGQTGVYGLETPGGWRIIGRTPITMFNPRLSPHTPVGPGDRVKFEPISADRFKFVKSASTTAAVPLTGIPVLEIKQPGIFSTVQDMGRPAFRHLGVPRSGGIDSLSQIQSNYIVGNSGGSPVLEVIGGYLAVRAMADVVVTVTGADCDLTLSGANVDTYSPLLLREGEDLAIGKTTRGFVNYLAVAGQLSVESVMGSCSTFVKGGFGGFYGRALKTGDVLCVTRLSDYVLMRGVSAAERTELSNEGPLKVVRSSLRDEKPSICDALFGAEFLVSESSDRTGYRLKPIGKMPKGAEQVLTYPTYPGYVEVPPGGSPIILQQDCPTTGGYLMAAAILPSEMGRFSQLKPGSKVSFKGMDAGSAAKDVAAFRKRLHGYASSITDL